MNKLLWLLLLPMFTHADVVSESDNGFVIHIERNLNTSSANAYQQFIKVEQWWHDDHTWFGQSKNLKIIPLVGECFCEIDGNKQALHMTVSYVEPNKEIRMVGGLGPLQMLGIHGGMSWKFETLTKNTSKVIFHYQVSGYMEGGFTQLAKAVDKVQTIQVERLQTKIASSYK